MDKIYTVILEDKETGDGIDISINNCGLPMAKHHAEIFCKQHGIKNIVKRPSFTYRKPVNKRQVVWSCDIPLSIFDDTINELNSRN